MKIYNYIFTAIFAIAMITSCEQPTPEDETVTLEADRTAIEMGDTVTFTVFSGETDVTAEAQVFTSDKEELIDKKFSSETQGDYKFFAIYNDVASIDVTVTVNGNAVLTADKTSIAADGNETVTFTVSQDGNDITSECTLWMVPVGGEPVQQDGFTVSTTVPGELSFYATKGDNLRTNTVDILARVAENSEPASYNFRKRSLIIEVTGTWCGPCSLVKAGFKSLEQEGWDDAYVGELHSSDGLAVNAVFNNLGQRFIVPEADGSFGIPYYGWNFDKKFNKSGAMSTVAANANNIKTTTNSANSAPCTTGAAASYYEEDGQLTVFSKIAVSEAGNYKVNCLLLENNIEMRQTAYPEASEWDINNHLNVIRAIASNTDQSVTAGAQSSESFTWTFNKSSLYNKEKDPVQSHVLIFITKEENGVNIVNNVIRCDFNGTTGFEYAE